MKKTACIFIGILLFWFTLDIIGIQFGNFLLVVSAIKDEPIDVIWWIIFIVFFAVFLFKDKIGKYLLLAFLIAWSYIQYSMYFTKTGTSLGGYNNYFSDTYHIFSPSNTFLIKDTYHIFLDLFIFLALVSIIIFIIKARKKRLS